MLGPAFWNVNTKRTLCLAVLVLLLLHLTTITILIHFTATLSTKLSTATAILTSTNVLSLFLTYQFCRSGSCKQFCKSCSQLLVKLSRAKQQADSFKEPTTGAPTGLPPATKKRKLSLETTPDAKLLSTSTSSETAPATSSTESKEISLDARSQVILSPVFYLPCCYSSEVQLRHLQQRLVPRQSHSLEQAPWAFWQAPHLPPLQWRTFLPLPQVPRSVPSLWSKASTVQQVNQVRQAPFRHPAFTLCKPLSLKGATQAFASPPRRQGTSSSSTSVLRPGRHLPQLLVRRLNRKRPRIQVRSPNPDPADFCHSAHQHPCFCWR